MNLFSYETAEWLLVRITNIPCQSAKTAAEAWWTKSGQESNDRMHKEVVLQHGQDFSEHGSSKQQGKMENSLLQP